MGYTRIDWVILLSITTTLAILLLDNNAIPIILPTLQTHFSLTDRAVAWVMNGYYIGIAAFVMVGGRLTDIFGNKRTFLASSFAYILLSLLVCSSLAFIPLVFFRVTQGISMAFMAPAAMSIIVQTFPTKMRGRTWGISVLLGSIASWIGPILVGIILEKSSWRGAFLLGPALALFGLISVSLFVPEGSSQKNMSVNRFEAISFVALMFSLNITLMQSSKWGFTSFQILLSSIVVLICALLFGYSIKQKKTTLFDWNLMVNKKFLFCLLIVFTAQFMISLPFFWIEYLQFGRHYTPLEIGRIVGVSMIPSFLCAPLVGALADRFSPKLPVFFGFVSLIVSLVCFNQFKITSDFIFLCSALALFSMGQVFILTPAVAAALSYSSTDVRATAAGIYSTVRFLGASLGLACMTLARSYTYTLGEMFVFVHGGLIFFSFLAGLLTLVSLKSYNEIKTPS